MQKFAFLFPGQGSQALKMMDGFSDSIIVRNVFNQAREVLGLDFWAMLHEDTPENINQTINTQPLLLTASYATYLAWLDLAKGKKPTYVAGHSLGEYSALVASEVLDFVSALQLVHKRAQYMQQAVSPNSGAMAAVLGLGDEIVTKICQEVQASGAGIVAGVNFNAPGQVVVAGEAQAVNVASEQLKKAGARKVINLPVSVPSHCQLMQPAAGKLALVLNQVKFKAAQIPLLQNINAQITSDVAEIKQGLIAQLYSPVLWTKSVQQLATHQVDILVECGPGKVLSGLNKRIHETAQVFNLQNLANLAELNQFLNQGV